MGYKNTIYSVLVGVLILLLLFCGIMNTTTAMETEKALEPVTIKETGESYLTIQDAINKSNSSDTILVSPGTYEENLIVNKSLTIKAESNSPSGTILEPSISGPVIEIIPEGIYQMNVSIIGFNIDGNNDAPQGVVFSGISSGGLVDNNDYNITLKNNTISRTKYGGAYISNTDATYVLNNTFMDIRGFGINVGNTNKTQIIGNNLTNISSGNLKSYDTAMMRMSGISVISVNEIDVENNIIRNCGSYGILIYPAMSTIKMETDTDKNSQSTNVIGNEIYNVSDYYTGISVGGSLSDRYFSTNDNGYDILIKGNTIKAFYSGIYVVNDYNVDITDNEIKIKYMDIRPMDNEIAVSYPPFGIFLKNNMMGDNYIDENIIDGGIYGVLTENTKFTKISDNSINNTDIGILSRNPEFIPRSEVGSISDFTSQPIIENNNLVNTSTGIDVTGSSNMSLSDNIIGGEEVRNGIECYRAQNASVIGNTINISFDEYETMGMSLYQLKNSTISGNSIKGAYLNIGIRESDDNTISNNYISDADYGLYFGNLYMFESLEISTAEIQYESITTTNATVYGNTIINSSISGIYLESTENSTFYDNYLNNINNTVFGEDNDNNAWNIEKTSIENIVGGPYQGGNYWIHPNGTGFSVDTDDVNNDGFCDQSYVITGNDTDVLPLAPAPAPEDKVSKEKDDKVSSFRRTPTSVGPSMPPENVESTDSLMKRIVSGSNIRYDFSNGGGPVMGISFESKEDKGKVVARIQVLKEKPEDVGDTSGNSYKMMSINVGKEDTISENNAEGILIEFKVSWEWINDNNIDPSTIRLSRYHDGEWVDLPGENIGDDGEFLYFNAYTPGFSIFSIVGDEAKESVTEEQVDEQSVTKKSVPDQTIAEEEPKEESAEESAQTPGFTSIFAVAFIAIVALYLRKKD